jgi:hypothetical protein
MPNRILCTYSTVTLFTVQYVFGHVGSGGLIQSGVDDSSPPPRDTESPDRMISAPSLLLKNTMDLLTGSHRVDAAGQIGT